MDHIVIEDHSSIQQAIADFELGFDFADVAHHASYKNCISVVSFDDKKFARRAKRNGFMPSVMVPK